MTAAAFDTIADTSSSSRPGAWMRSEEARGLAMISPTFLYALAVLFLPVLIVIAYSFWTQNYLDIDRTFTLENYRQALTEPIYRDLFIRSLWISLTVSIVTVVFSYPIAWFISFHGGVHKNLWLFLITVPCWTSYLLRVVEGHPRLWRGHEHRPHLDGSHRQAGDLAPLQFQRRRHHAGA